MTGDIIYTYLDEAVRRGASDIYLTVGAPPTFRVADVMIAREGSDKLTEADIDGMLEEVLTPSQRHEFRTRLELNVALERGTEGRFRASVLRQRQCTAVVIRRILTRIPSFEELSLPPVMEALAQEKRGLILVCGTTASGKSTTMAAMIDHRNRNTGGHIITIEDPIEFYHEHQKGLISQREIDIDTFSPHVAMKNALRQKPDVLVVGEVRDAGMMELCVAAAETGHLCMATLHASNAAQAIERIVGLFREGRQQQCRTALALNLRAIIVQRLVQAKEGGHMLVSEVMLNEALIRELIMRGETDKIHEIMSKNAAAGMMTFDQSLLNLYRRDMISEETTIIEADVPANMKIAIRQHKLGNRPLGSTAEIDTSELSL